MYLDQAKELLGHVCVALRHRGPGLRIVAFVVRNLMLRSQPVSQDAVAQETVKVQEEIERTRKQSREQIARYINANEVESSKS